MAHDLTPETELLVLCARARLTANDTVRVKGLAGSEIDWEHLSQVADRHRLTPLLYWHLNATCPEAVPGPILNRLRERFRGNAGRNLSMLGELWGVLKLLEAHNIPAIPYKGPILAVAAYGDLSLRESTIWTFSFGSGTSGE